MRFCSGVDIFSFSDEICLVRFCVGGFMLLCAVCYLYCVLGMLLCCMHAEMVLFVCSSFSFLFPLPAGGFILFFYRISKRSTIGCFIVN